MRKTMLAAALGAMALLGAACGGDDESATAQEGPDEIRVGVLPIAAVTPLYVAMEQGFFAEENLEVVPEIGTGGAALLPAVLQEDYAFGFSNMPSLVIAAEQGLPVEIVANGSDELMTPEKVNSVVVVGQDSDIRDAADLAGKEIAVNAVENVGDLTIRAALDERGVDSSTVEFREIPFPDMLPALDTGRIDAIWLVEPFSTMATDAGNRVVLRPYYETRPGLTISAWFTTQQFSQENPELTERFVRALNEGIQYAQDNPQDTRRVMQGFTSITPDIAEKMTLPTYSTSVDPENVAFSARLMERYGMIEEVPDIDRLIRDAE